MVTSSWLTIIVLAALAAVALFVYRVTYVPEPQ